MHEVQVSSLLPLPPSLDKKTRWGGGAEEESNIFFSGIKTDIVQHLELLLFLSISNDKY